MEPVATATALLVGATTSTFSGAGSKFELVGAEVTGKHDGAFRQFSGTIQLPERKAEARTVDVDVDMALLTADDPKLTGHLKSPDLFDVEKLPKARFTSIALPWLLDQIVGHAWMVDPEVLAVDRELRVHVDRVGAEGNRGGKSVRSSTRFASARRELMARPCNHGAMQRATSCPFHGKNPGLPAVTIARADLQPNWCPGGSFGCMLRWANRHAPARARRA
jgi:YceI-like domain